MSEIVIEGDGKFPMDIQVPIVGMHYGKDRSITIAAQGTHRGRPVGLESLSSQG